MRYSLRTLLVAFAITPPLVAYVGSYYALSRRGYAYSDSVGAKAFWFVPPETRRAVKKNEEYAAFYRPLIRLEHLCGGNRYVAGEPCFFSGDRLPP